MITTASEKGLAPVAILIVIAIIAAIAGGSYYLSTNQKGALKTDGGKTVNYERNGQQATVSENGSTLVVGEGVKIPPDFPKNIPIYPKGKLTSALVSKDEIISSGYTLETSDDFATIMKWFREEFPKKGWKVNFEDQFGIMAKNGDITGSVSILKTNNVNSVSFSSGKTGAVNTTQTNSPAGETPELNNTSTTIPTTDQNISPDNSSDTPAEPQ